MLETIMAGMKDMQTQIGQLSTEVNQMKQKGSSALPSQPRVNPKGDLNAVTLRSGKQLQSTDDDQDRVPASTTVQVTTPLEKVEPPQPTRSTPVIPLPFPSRVRALKQREVDPELMEIFKKVEINIPLLEAVRQVPKYAKFLKELCTYKRKLKGASIEAVSTLSQLPLPQKCGDPGSFSIPCTIGHLTFGNALIDLGASINVMPTALYRMLQLGDLKETNVVIQLANKTTVKPLGVLEDVLVKVDQLIFPADFYILDMDEEKKTSQSTIILGRPFLMTAKTIINMHGGFLTMEFGGEKVTFNIFGALKHPFESSTVIYDRSLCELETVDDDSDCKYVNNVDTADVGKTVEVDETLDIDDSYDDLLPLECDILGTVCGLEGQCANSFTDHGVYSAFELFSTGTKEKEQKNEKREKQNKELEEKAWRFEKFEDFDVEKPPLDVNYVHVGKLNGKTHDEDRKVP